MNLTFKIYYPGGNPTALLDQSVKPGQRARIAQAIMKKFTAIEQVGFLSDKKNQRRLNMMGNELCINAAQAAALYWSRTDQTSRLAFHIPGLKQKLQAEVKKNQVSLKLPKSIISSTQAVAEGTLVNMPGIRYLLHAGAGIKQPDVKALIKKYQANFPAVGVIQIKKSPGHVAIQPWVWVRATQTLILETACGSGSIAAAFFAKQTKIRQPSGQIYQIKFNSQNVLIESAVKYLGEKTITIKSL